MSEFRRRLMMATQGGVTPPQKDYISDGLIFRLDGIDKGTTEGKWTDLVGGYVFDNDGATSTTYGWQMSSGNGLKRAQISLTASNNYTVEVCVTPTALPYFVFVLNNNSSSSMPLFYINASRKITFLQKQNTYTLLSHTNNSPQCVSLNLDVGCHNGNSLSKDSGTDYWGNDSYAHIGRRGSNGNFFNGVVHAIRIYDRRLTLQEMKNNQQVDNTRFNLGLTI